MTASVLGIYNYWIYVLLMMIGLYGVIAKPNLIKQAIALGLFQTGIFLYYISMAVIDGGTGLPAIDWTDTIVATGDELARRA